MAEALRRLDTNTKTRKCDSGDRLFKRWAFDWVHREKGTIDRDVELPVV